MMRFMILLAGFVLWAVPYSAAEQISEDDKASVLRAVIKHLEVEYVDPEIGQAAAAALRQSVSRGKFESQSHGSAYADHLSAVLQDFTGDGHLNVEYSAVPIALSQADETEFEADQLEQYYGAHRNFGVEKVARLDGNVGLIDLRVFAPIDMGGNTVTAAMNTIAHTDALIIDLRKNGGGMGDMADLVASYLFGAERQPLTGVYDRPTDTITQRFTQPFVPGERFGPDKPVYVLISSRTFSAAEALAYNLQALDRATIVGEVSGGGAHPFEYLPVHQHFVLWSVTAKSVHPLTQSNWQGVGVQPDIKSNADDALAVALDHLERLKAGAQP